MKPVRTTERVFIRSLRSEIKALQVELDNTFASLTEFLPRAGSELVALDDALSSCAADSSDASLLPRLSALRGTGHALSSTTRAALDADGEVAQWVHALGASSETLGASFEKVVDLSATLRLVAFNASAAAARAGAHAAGFAVLTQELGAMAKRTTAAVSKMREDAGAIHELSTDVLAGRTNLHALMEDFVARSQQMGNAIDTSLASLTALREAIEAFRVRAAANTQPIGAIMIAAQRQDIIRQKLDHVLLALSELESTQQSETTMAGDSPSVEMCRFQSRIGRLGASLLQDIVGDLETLLNDVSTGLRTLDAASGALSSLQDLVPDDAAVRARMTAPALVLRQVQDSFGPIADLIAQQSGVMDRIPAPAKRLAKQLNALTGLNMLLSSINALVKIEVSRSEVLISKATLSKDIGRLQREYAEVVQSAAYELPELVRAGAALSHASERLSGQRRQLEAIESDVKGTVDELQNAAVTFSNAFGRSMGIASTLANQAGRFRQSLDALHDNTARSREAVRQLEELAQRADSAARGLPASSARIGGELDQRLKEIVDKFTVVSHKAAATGIAGSESYVGDAPGTLTLF